MLMEVIEAIQRIEIGIARFVMMIGWVPLGVYLWGKCISRKIEDNTSGETSADQKEGASADKEHSDEKGEQKGWKRRRLTVLSISMYMALIISTRTMRHDPRKN